MVGVSFDKVANQYDPLIKKLLIKYCLLWDYEEMYQIGLIALWEAWGKYNPDKGPFPAYAKAIIKGRVLTEVKKRKRYSDFHLTTEDTPERAMDSNENHETLVEELLQSHILSNREKCWLKKAIVLEKKTKIIAEEEKVSVDTVRSWKKTAMKKINLLVNKE